LFRHRSIYACPCVPMSCQPPSLSLGRAVVTCSQPTWLTLPKGPIHDRQDRPAFGATACPCPVESSLSRSGRGRGRRLTCSRAALAALQMHTHLTSNQQPRPLPGQGALCPQSVPASLHGARPVSPRFKLQGQRSPSSGTPSRAATSSYSNTRLCCSLIVHLRPPCPREKENCLAFFTAVPVTLPTAAARSSTSPRHSPLEIVGAVIHVSHLLRAASFRPAFLRGRLLCRQPSPTIG